MAGRIGRQSVFKFGGTDPADIVAGVREISVEASGEPIDVTSNEDDGVRTLLTDVTAQDEVSISISGVTKDTIIKDAWFAGNKTQPCSITYPDASVLSGTFFLVSYNEGDPYNDAATFEASLVSSGALTYA